MRVEKRATPSRQAKRVAQRSNHSVTRQRLTDEEWAAVWRKDGWVLAVGFCAFFALVTIMEVL